MGVQTSATDLEYLSGLVNEDFNVDVSVITTQPQFKSMSMLRRIIANYDFSLLSFILTKTNFKLDLKKVVERIELLQLIAKMNFYLFLPAFQSNKSAEEIATDLINGFVEKKCPQDVGIALLSLRVVFFTNTVPEPIRNLSDYLFEIFVDGLEKTGSCIIPNNLAMHEKIPTDVRLSLFARCAEYIGKINFDSNKCSIQFHLIGLLFKIQTNPYQTENMKVLLKMCEMIFKHTSDDRLLSHLNEFDKRLKMTPFVYFKLFEIIIRNYKGYIHPDYLKIAEKKSVCEYVPDPHASESYFFDGYGGEFSNCVRLCSYKLLVFVVCVSDDYLKISENSDLKLSIFFKQSKNLPLEIQHKLCCSVYGIQTPYSSSLFNEMCRF